MSNNLKESRGNSRNHKKLNEFPTSDLASHSCESTRGSGPSLPHRVHHSCLGVLAIFPLAIGHGAVAGVKMHAVELARLTMLLHLGDTEELAKLTRWPSW